MWTIEAFDAAVRSHDARIAALGLVIWVGSEPTFTDRFAQSPEWLNTALGGEKEQRAQAVLAGLGRRFPGGVVMRSVGRQYPGEAAPRWSLGLYRRRDGTPIWQGPPDPIMAGPERAAAQHPHAGLDAWTDALAAALAARGLAVLPVKAVDPSERRLLVRAHADVAAPAADDSRLARASVHSRATPASGLRDELADDGLHLFVLSQVQLDGGPVARIELPRFGSVPMALAVLVAVQDASLACCLPSLVLAGHPPPADASVEWTTVTPDPAVVEINTAPSVDAGSFLERSREIYAAAADEGLAPYRLYFNGAVADSGGGGQITLGGPSPQASPFLQQPRLLPRLVRFFNRHPALSYLFSHDYVGSSGQSVRADERGNDAFDELALALTLMEREEPLTTHGLWHGLAPFLCDAAGNSHRAEINIEKLWNPFLDDRGKQGLVEFRALRMQHTPERGAALACLLRGLVAMLTHKDDALPLVDWGRELHDRFALPFYLEQDLNDVLRALDDAGLGLGESIQAVLRRESFRRWGQLELPGCTLEVRRALEFWPLLGDAASPEQGGGSRLVDSSTTRVELRLRPQPVDDGQAAAPAGAAARSGSVADWRGWTISAAGIELPLRHERDAAGELKVFGLRYRSHVPGWGLHPALGAQAPVHLQLRHPAQPTVHLVGLHEWQPAGEAYRGLPDDLAEAARRRAERITLQTLPDGAEATVRSALVRPSAGESSPGLGRYVLDLRAVPGAW